MSFSITNGLSPASKTSLGGFIYSTQNLQTFGVPVKIFGEFHAKFGIFGIFEN